MDRLTVLMRMSFLMSLLLFISVDVIIAQGWDMKIGTGNAQSIVPVGEGKYLVSGDGFDEDGFDVGSGHGFLTMINDNGDKFWTRMCPEYKLSTLPNGNILGVPIRFFTNTEIVEMDTNGTVINSAPTLQNMSGPSFIPTPPAFVDSDHYFMGFYYGDSGYGILDKLGKFDSNHNLILEATLPNTEVRTNQAFINNPPLIYDDKILIYYSLVEPDGFLLKVLEYDFFGNLLQEHTLNTEVNVKKIIFENNELFAFGHSDQWNFSMLNIDLETGSMTNPSFWTESTFLMSDVVVLEDGLNLYGFTTEDNFEEYFTILKIDFQGNLIWRSNIDHNNAYVSSTELIRTDDGNLIGLGLLYFQGANDTQSYLFQANPNGVVFSNAVSGSVRFNLEDDCIYNNDDSPLEGWLVEMRKESQYFATHTDESGTYTLPADTGNYIITLTPPNNYWTVCENEISINFNTFENSVNQNFVALGVVDCPYLTVDIEVPTVRPCVVRSGIIEYCNNGTVAAQEVEISVSLDPELILSNASLPFTNINDSVYIFEIGSLDVFECGTIDITTFLDCDAETGLTYCLEAHITPDSLCIPSTASWSGALLEATARCEGENVYLNLTNIGDDDMDQNSDYIIVEDAILRIMDSLRLDQGETEEFVYPANGSTYALLANQVAGAPELLFPSVVVEGCGENEMGNISTFFGNQFSLNDGDPYLDTDCPVAVNSFDPNDKNGYPLGFTEENLINPETEIEYVIRFQNTGTDTAYVVIIKDTLDQQLDYSTFIKGPSSHPYNLDVDGQGYVKFSFYNINLPDSNANAIGSNGFVTYKIKPRADLPIGSVIENQAAIYFDYNDPIYTNTTQHKIGQLLQEVIVGTTEHPNIKNIDVKVYPNPFAYETRFEINGHFSEKYILEIYDPTGKLMRTQELQSHELLFRKDNLSKGIYHYRILSLDGFMNTGSIIIQ